jgi:hypothetical protein
MQRVYQFASVTIFDTPEHANLILIALLVLPVLLDFAYGHGVANSLTARPIRIDNEQFSTNRVSVGEAVTITGDLERTIAKPTAFTLLIFAAPSFPYSEKQSVSIPLQFQLLDIFYPPIRDQATMYFDVRHNLSNPTTLEPGTMIGYEIKVYPQKTGTFHIHTLVIADDRKYIGRGQTVTVSGGDDVILGDVTQVFVPLALGTGALVALTTLIMRKGRAGKPAVLGSRLYFAAKSSFETAWVFGIVSWLSSSPQLFAFEASYFRVVAVTLVLAAIMVGGYISALSAVRRRQHAFDIALLVATVAFYLALDSSPLTYQFEQFRAHPIVWQIAVVANSAAATLITLLVVRNRRLTRDVSLG